MQTKLGVLCDRVIEAGWLLAVILAPLYFNVYSNRVFEPDKIALVRSIALFMSLAWLVKVLDTNILANRQKLVNTEPSPPLWKRIQQQNILALPTLAMVVAYIISTITSVSPMVSLWGSYQRLQGTYTTFSYIVIFFLAVGTIQRREQVERLISVIIITSVPISVYGMVEHLKLEFLPWGGDVTLRVTSTMGNPIFIAAYLIMTVPLALMRFLDRLSSYSTTVNETTPEGSSPPGKAIALIPIIEAVAAFLIIYFGLEVYGDIIQGLPIRTSDMAMLVGSLILAAGVPFVVRRSTPLMASASFYGAVTLVELATVIFSQSRGPQLGLAAGLVVFVFLLAMKWNSRLVWFSGLTAAVLGLAFLIAINVPNTPLAFVRQLPYIGRLGTVLDDPGSTQVRTLIWEGVEQLIAYHAPLQVPEHAPDSLNILRPLIGYGPDAMYVAYNRFYPPDLAHIEARNASPDRSHNETFDALVMTGILGYLAYWFLFYTVMYIGLKYMGVINDRHGRYLYAALMATGLLVLVLIYGRILPVKLSPLAPLLGVGILALYLVLQGIFTYDWKGKLRAYDLILVALVAAVVAHFVEVQFGIAIASTRTHFWTYAALIVVAGRLSLQAEEPAKEAPLPTPEPAAPVPMAAPRPPAATSSTSFKKRKKSKMVAAGRPRQEARPAAPRPAPRHAAEPGMSALIAQVLPSALPLSVVGGLILATMAYNFMLPPTAQTSNPSTTSVQFWLYFITWLSCGLMVAFDREHEPGLDEINERISALIVYTVTSLAMWVGYVALRSLVLAIGGQQPDPNSLVDAYYITAFVYGLLLCAVLYVARRAGALLTWSGPIGGMIYAAAAAVVLFFVISTNVNIVLADVYYKTGLAYDNAQRWDGSIQAYQNAIRLEPAQDFYYLFLGRSYMELARQFPDRAANPPYDVKTESPLTMTHDRLGTLGRQDLIQASLFVLTKARDLNPLNTDHYANLARLYRFWAESGDQSKLVDADKYFAEATSLSPNNAQLWDEWAVVSMMRGMNDDAQTKLQHSLELDSEYDLTRFYLGNLYMSMGESNQDQTQKLQQLTEAVDAYSECLKLTPTYAECAKARGYIYGKYLGRPQDAIADFKLVASLLPKPEDVNRIANPNDKQLAIQELVNVNQNLAITYGQIGQLDQALAAAQVAANLSPDDQGLKTLVDQIQQQISITTSSSNP